MFMYTPLPAERGFRQVEIPRSSFCRTVTIDFSFFRPSVVYREYLLL